MLAVLKVYAALRSFDRGATRRELEVETAMDKRSVQHGLAGLLRRQLLIVDGAPNRLSTYRLIDGAELGGTLRGRYDRVAEPLMPAPRDDYSPARPPSHTAQPGASRMVVKGILDVHRRQPDSFGPCALAELWRKR